MKTCPGGSIGEGICNGLEPGYVAGIFQGYNGGKRFGFVAGSCLARCSGTFYSFNYDFLNSGYDGSVQSYGEAVSGGNRVGSVLGGWCAFRTQGLRDTSGAEWVEVAGCNLVV